MAEKKGNEEAGIIPAGAPLPPEEGTEEIIDAAPKTIKVGGKEYESPEALAAAYQSLESKLGEQGDELGQLRTTTKTLTEQLTSMQEAARKEGSPGEATTTYESQLADIYKQLEDGDLSIEQAMQQSNALTAEMAAEKAVAKASESFQTTLQERDAEGLQKQFLKDHSDFTTLRDSGKLEPFKQEYGGMHDDFSAYFAYKAAEAFENGKAEAARLAAGDTATKTVLTKAGESITQTNKQKTPLNDAEMEASMLKAALQGAGGG